MQINNRIFLVQFNANNQNITSPSVEDLYPVSVLVESISTKQPKRRKIKIVLKNCPIINQDLQYMHLSVQNLFSQEQRSDLPITGRSKHFKKKNWKKLTYVTQTLEITEGYQIPFSSEPTHMKPPNPNHLTEKE